MKFTLYAGLAGLVALPAVLAQATISNNDVTAAVVVPDTYIVKFKANADGTKKKKYTDNLNAKAKKANKKGVVDTINLAGIDAAVVEIPASEIKALLESDQVSTLENAAR